MTPHIDNSRKTPADDPLIERRSLFRPTRPPLVKAATRPGRLGDGDGLFLIVQPSGSKSWMVRVQKNGNRRDFGLGSAAKVSLAKARERAREVRTWMEMGLDPLFERRKAQGIAAHIDWRPRR